MAETEQTVHDEYFLLWVLIAQTKDAILRARERDYARYGITNDRRAVLYAIERNGGSATPVEISRNLFRELHSVTEMLKRMEADGLITREKTSGRSRIVAQDHREGTRRLQRVAAQRDRQAGLLGLDEEGARASAVVAHEGPRPRPSGPRHPRVAAQPRAPR